MRNLSILLTMAICAGCATMSYVDPDTGAKINWNSLGKSVENVQIVYTSPDKTVAISIGSTSNDPIFEQIGTIIKAYK
jgi:hypothetical protein